MATITIRTGEDETVQFVTVMPDGSAVTNTVSAESAIALEPPIGGRIELLGADPE